ncbi:MerR family transcriptional regulator [Streptomyces sp. NPDC012794]|uniref:DNA polymerase III subunit beta family protein n=1 Tax=Streptomyces sp. NPDC012794 TaxID=3364850 RepID=UPI0036B52667
MGNEMRSIGEMARDSGLGVSALRFYDGAGVLVPDRVDPVSGYRWYGPGQLEEARLLARLRRAGMPLADIRLVTAGWAGGDTALVLKLLREHLLRLERGLSDARSEFSMVRALLDSREITMIPASADTRTVRLTLSGPALAAALDAVRFAASTDPELPMLGGVLFDIEGRTLRVVATDRYRLAVSGTGITGSAEYDGSRVQAVVPSPLVDAMRALLGDGGPVELAIEGDRVVLEAGERQAGGRCAGDGFPDYRRLVRLPAGRRAVVDVAAFREALRGGTVRSQVREQDGAAYDVSVLEVTDGGTATVCAQLSAGNGTGDRIVDGTGDRAGDRIGVNRAFLLDALAAGDRDRLVLEAGTGTTPLTVRRSDDEETYSLLMPVRVED